MVDPKDKLCHFEDDTLAILHEHTFLSNASVFYPSRLLIQSLLLQAWINRWSDWMIYVSTSCHFICYAYYWLYWVDTYFCGDKGTSKSVIIKLILQLLHHLAPSTQYSRTSSLENRENDDG